MIVFIYLCFKVNEEYILLEYITFFILNAVIDELKILLWFQDELKMAMDLIGEPMTEAQLDEMLKATDIDHDGRINYEGNLNKFLRSHCIDI